MAKRDAKKPRRAGAGFLTRVLILALLAATGWQLFHLHGQVAAAQEEKALLETQILAQLQENEALSADIAEGTTPEKMEEIAREELGMVAPGERVFIGN